MPVRPSSRGTLWAAGFTLIEILIAIVVLVIGITGILALFPTAIEQGNKTVEDSYAAAITQSVVDAISVGLRESKYSYQPPGGGPPFHYFMLDHDGVLDAPIPDGKVNDYGTADLWKKDFTILLPRAKDVNNKSSANEPVFTYPVVPSDHFVFSDPPDDPRQPSKLGVDDPNDDSVLLGVGDPRNMWKPTYLSRPGRPDTAVWYRRAFALGRYRDGTEPLGDAAWRRQIRKEFLVLETANSTSDRPENYAFIDPYPQYSFAIAIKRARIDTTGDGKLDENDGFSNDLFEVRILIFRNFDSSPELHREIFQSSRPIPKSNLPIREFVTLVSI